MGGTKAGGIAARDTNIIKYGNDFYPRIGAKGGRAGNTGGFAAGEEGRARARIFGAIGGAISRRTDSPTTLRPRAKKVNKPCTFCNKNGHRAYTCPVRSDLTKRKQIAFARQRVLDEENELKRDKLKALARKYR